MRYLLATLLLFLALPANADQTLDREIDHLLGYIKKSGCVFIRNGSRHDAEAAIAHIKKKQDYFSDDIASTEDFIELSASKSTISKKPYQIDCPGKPMIQSQDWLLLELARYRKQG